MPKSESMPLCPFLLVVWLVSSGSRSAGSCVLVGRVIFFFVIFLTSALKDGFYRGEGRGRGPGDTTNYKKKIKKRIAHQFWPLVFDNSLIRLASRVYYKAPSPSPSPSIIV